MNCFSFKKNKNKQHKANSAPELRKQNTANTSNNKRVSKSTNSVSTSKSIPELYKERQHYLRVFTYEELSEATDGFNKLLRIGEGGFGSVFKGTINTPNKGNPTVVAIKKLNRYGLQVFILSTSFFIVICNLFNMILSELLKVIRMGSLK